MKSILSPFKVTVSAGVVRSARELRLSRVVQGAFPRYDYSMAEENNVQVSFSEFWSWLSGHPNCILRAGTPEIMIYDDLDFHWILGRDERDVPNIQLYHGKRPVADFYLVEEAVDWVRGFPSDLEGEYIFELVHQENENSFVSYFFVMSHGIDEDNNRDNVH